MNEPAALPSTGAEYRIGAVRVQRILETSLTVSATTLFADWRDDVVAAHPEWTAQAVYDPVTGTVPLPVCSWLVRTDDRVILIDTGIGAGKLRPFGPAFDRLDSPLLRNLATAGVMPDAVTHVLLTHLHTDHVGWNTQARDGVWVPSFPNARYIYSPDELTVFTDPARLDARTRNSFAAVQDSVLPVIAARQAEGIARDGAEVLSGFTYHAAYGHSPFHMVIAMDVGGARALFSADAMHHPVQVEHPDWSVMFDGDPRAAAASRHAMLKRAVESGAQVFTAHFGASGTGHVTRVDDRFRWNFA